jgi:hypothetical protein
MNDERTAGPTELENVRLQGRLEIDRRALTDEEAEVDRLKAVLVAERDPTEPGSLAFQLRAALSESPVPAENKDQELRERMELIERFARAFADVDCENCEGDGIDREGAEGSLCECLQNDLCLRELVKERQQRCLNRRALRRA